MSSDRTTAPFSLGENAPVRTTWRTLLALAALAATAFGSWLMVRAQVEGHEVRLNTTDKRIEAVEARFANDHDILLEIRADLKALTRERRANP